MSFLSSLSSFVPIWPLILSLSIGFGAGIIGGESSLIDNEYSSGKPRQPASSANGMPPVAASTANSANSSSASLRASSNGKSAASNRSSGGGGSRLGSHGNSKVSPEV